MIVKICGITRLEDATVAAGEGADAVGFVFVQSSPRYIDPARVHDIICQLPPTLLTVGVFENASAEDITRTVRETGIGCVQLLGEGLPEVPKVLPVKVWKVFHVAGDFNVSRLRDWPADAFVLDTFVPGMSGGTGVTFDWTIAAQASAIGRVILAGGLRPGNVEEAVEVARPFGVDVSSGVERSSGIKDHDRIREFISAARRAERQHNIP